MTDSSSPTGPIPAANYLAAVIESSNDAIVSSDRHGRIASWNPAAARLFGYSADEIVGRPVFVLFPPAGVQSEIDALERVWQGEIVQQADTILLRKDGEPVETSVTLSPIRNDAGDVVGASKIIREMGERRRLEMAALHLASVVASSDDAIISKDLNGIVRSWNPTAERLFGYTAEEMIGQSIKKILPEDRLAEEDDVLAKVRQGLSVDHFETVRQAKDGRLIDISLTVSAILDRAGTVIGASKIARDIGHHKRTAEAAVHLAAVVESADDAIISKDLNGIVRSWNPAAERLFGYTADDMIGESITRMIPRERLGEETHVLREIRAGRTVDHFETMRQTKDGRLVEISLTVSPIRDATGRIVGASKIARDIREHKRLLEETRVAAANEEAARREVLEVHSRRIQEASRVKSEFVANMSHELRTPLNAIVGFAELIADERFGPLPSKYQEFARIMSSSAHHLLQLINDILDLAKVESGKIDFHPERVDLRAVIDEVKSIVTGLAKQRGITLQIDADAQLREAHLDPMRLKQVLYNYLSNAIKFSPEGGVVVLRTRREGRERFRIEVEDRGIGIKPDEQHRLFIEFQQLDATTAKRFPGSGLGLALTRRLVEAQGGTVGVESVFGIGSTFFAILPLVIDTRSADVATGAGVTNS